MSIKSLLFLLLKIPWLGLSLFDHSSAGKAFVMLPIWGCYIERVAINVHATIFCEHIFHFSGINTQELDYLVEW